MNETRDDDLQQAQLSGFRVVQRAIPTAEGAWRRGGELARVKLGDLEGALPAEVPLEEIGITGVTACVDGAWQALPFMLDYADGYGRWSDAGRVTPDTRLCFPAPERTTAAAPPDGALPLKLWDSRDRAWLEGLAVQYRRGDATPLPAPGLALEATEHGYAVRLDGAMLLHFTGERGCQIDFACPPGGANLVPAGRTWRWLLTETSAELDRGDDLVEFTPQVTAGPVLVITVAGQAQAGRMTATLRIFLQRGALVLEFSDYRAVRARPELPPDEHPRSYAGQTASPYPGIHYAAFMLEADKADIFDHLYRFGPLPAIGPPAFVYTGERKMCGWNWLALDADGGTAGIAAHNRTHYPDQPFKAGGDDNRACIALEPFGSEVDGHYHSCDRYLLILAESVEVIRETFDTLDTCPLLAAAPLRRDLDFLDTYACLARWTNLSLDYFLRDGCYRNCLLTDGSYHDDADTCLTPFSEIIRLYEKTGWAPFRDAAAGAAAHAARWILDGRFITRGEGVGPNGGGIYQNEQEYLLLGMARVWRNTGDPLLARAIAAGVQCLQDTRGGVGTWGWDDFPWHAGGWDRNGKAIYYWPVNTNQFATLCFRLYQLLGDRRYYDEAMAIIEEYLRRIPADSWEIVRGGGVSDTTRGVHLFAEVLEVAGNDPRIDREYLTACIRNTLERFWIEGWAQIRHAIYGEVIYAGDTPGEIFSPGFRHWHNCGSHLDILPRMQAAAEAGVSEHLTRWAMRDFALDFDVRYGVEEHTHLTPFSMRDTDLEPACWLDCELLPTLFAVRTRGWVSDDDFRLLHYKIHRMVQRAFIPLDALHGGWAACYDSHGGQPIKYLAYWEARHSFEAFAPNEPLELWGVTTRDAFYDHGTRYWNVLEQLVDELVTAETVAVRDGCQVVRCADDGLGAGLPIPRPLLTPRDPAADDIAAEGWRITETRTVTIGGQAFWLCAIERE